MSKAVRRPPKVEKGMSIERARARGIVELCKQAIAAGGTLVLNPEAPYDEQQTFTPDLDYLLRALKDFADHGTFHHDPKSLLPHFWMAQRVRDVVRACHSERYQDRVYSLMDKFEVEETTARRLMKDAGL